MNSTVCYKMHPTATEYVYGTELDDNRFNVCCCPAGQAVCPERRWLPDHQQPTATQRCVQHRCRVWLGRTWRVSDLSDLCETVISSGSVSVEDVASPALLLCTHAHVLITWAVTPPAVQYFAACWDQKCLHYCRHSSSGVPASTASTPRSPCTDVSQLLWLALPSADTNQM